MTTAVRGWRFDHSYLGLPDPFYTQQAPEPVSRPRLILFNHALARSLGLEAESDEQEAIAALFAGNALPEGARPFAQAYAGHQFGGFSMLGDGRAIILGEHVTPDGRRVDIQFKGSGPTPYSRSGDGRAALAPMLREYVISEAMQALGIPTTRSLAVVATGDPVHREDVLPGALLTRVASSHLRVGTFQFAAARQDYEGLERLVDYAIDRHDPDLAGAEAKALALFRRVAGRQVDLIVEWMRVGFIHGVMNTDNVTISGETIDYGPCAFMDAYDPATVFSSIDFAGRYAYANQPRIVLWNLARFAEALLPLLHDEQDRAVEIAETELHAFSDRLDARLAAMMRAKIGLADGGPDDDALVAELLAWMQENAADYTNTFRALSHGTVPEEGPYADPAFRAWYGRWQQRLAAAGTSSEQACALMRKTNPAYIPRNHLVEAALARASSDGDLSLVESMLDVIARPYEERDGLDAYTEPNPMKPGHFQTFCGT